MKIKKYASGGVYTPFIPPTKSVAKDSKTTKSGSSGKDKSPELPFKKELIDMLNSEGLPSDNSVFYSELSSILTRYQYADDIDVPAHVAMAFSKKVQDMKLLKAEFEDAVDAVRENDTAEDIATSGRYIYVEDRSSENRTMTLITPSQYLENPEKYTVLTNKEILNARKYDPNLGFTTSTIVYDASHATSMDQLTEKWRKKTKELASQSVSGELRQDATTVDLITGAQLIQRKGGIAESSTTLQHSQVQNYLMSLYDSMTGIEKGYLASYLAVEKGMEATAENIMSVMYSNIVGYVSTSSDYSPPSKGKGSGSGSGSGSGDDISGVTQDNQAIRVQRGAGVPEPVTIKPKPSAPGQNVAAFTTSGYNYGNYLDYSDKPITGSKSVKTLMEEAIVFAATTRGKDSAYIGTKHLSQWDLSQVLWKNTYVQVADLPAKTESDGTVRPWFELLDIMGHANSGNRVSNITITEYLKQKGIPTSALKYNEATKKYELNMETRQFLIVQGYIGTDTLGLSDSQKRYVEKVSEKEAERFLNAANDLLGEIGWLDQDNEEDDFYVGNIYIPIDANPYPAISGTMNFYHNKDDFNPNYGLEVQAGQAYREIQSDPNRKEITRNFSE